MGISSLRYRSPRPTGWLRAGAVGAALALVLTAQVPGFSVLPASYSASVSPDVCQAESDCTLEFTITNESPPDSAHFMDRASITAPAGFSDVAVVEGSVTTSSLVPKNWSASVSGNTVNLSANTAADSLGPLESLSVSVVVVASLATVGPNNTFDTSASNSALNDNFELEGAEPSVTVVNQAVNCEASEGSLGEADPECKTGNVTQGNTTASAAASVGGEALLTLSVGGSFQHPTCSGFEAMGLAVTTNVVTTDDGDDRSHEVKVTVDKNVPNKSGVGNWAMCVAADAEFWTDAGTFAEENEDTGFFEGLLPPCDPTNPLITKCIKAKYRNSGNTVIEIFVDPGDPISIPGLGPVNV